MSDWAIRVENVGKAYTLHRRSGLGTLKRGVTYPLRRLLRRPSAFREEEVFWALRNVSFEVKPGEVVGVIGRNGAGKSTLLKLFSRITAPTEGRIQIRGRVGSLLEVGTGFHPELTGRENVFLNGAILGMTRPEIAGKFDEIVAFAEIEKFIDTPVKHYSSGMYTRLAFAVAAHLEPETLIVDEVLAVGDLTFQKKCLGRMSEISSGGRTILFVSHNMNAVAQLCRNALYLDQGKVVAHGSVEQVIAVYLRDQSQNFGAQTVASWNPHQRPRPFFREITVNGQMLPAEVVLKVDQPVRIEMYGDTGLSQFRHFRSAVHVETQDGVKILVYGSAWSGLGDRNILGPAKVTCQIDRLPLIPGRYFVSIGCSDDQGQADWLERICVFSVATSAHLSKGVIPQYKNHGYILTDSSWDLVSQTKAPAVEGSANLLRTTAD